MKHIRQLLFNGLNDLPWHIELGSLILRVAAGLGLAMAHGINKMSHVTEQDTTGWGPPPGFIEGVSEMGFPMPTFFAWSAGLAEFVGGIFIAAGLLTRPAALFATCVMITAFTFQHGGRGFADGELAMLYGSIMILFLLTGAGRVSLDRLLRPGKPEAL